MVTWGNFQTPYPENLEFPKGSKVFKATSKKRSLNPPYKGTLKEKEIYLSMNSSNREKKVSSPNLPI